MFEETKVPEGINKDVLEHIMHPKNYGKLDNPSGVGVALDERTGEYVVFYVLLEDDLLKSLRFATNGCQDTVVVGFMFSEMVENNTIEYAQSAIEKMKLRLEKLTTQQEICANIVLSAFSAATINASHRADGIKEELHLIKMEQSCEIEDKIASQIKESI